MNTDDTIILKKNGQWIYRQRPLINEKIIRYFFSILRRDGDRYFLQNEREKVDIIVEGLPLFIHRVIFYEIDGELCAELLLCDGQRYRWDPSGFSIDQDGNWVQNLKWNDSILQAAFTKRAKIDLVAEASATDDMAELRISGTVLRLPLTEEA